MFSDFIGPRSGFRARDPLCFKQVLFRLSYPGMAPGLSADLSARSFGDFAVHWNPRHIGGENGI